MNAAQTLLAAGCDDQVALQCCERQVNYRSLRRLVRQSAGAWQSRGLRAGERVFVIAADDIEWVVTWLGVIWAGGVAVGVDPRLPPGKLQPMLAEGGPRFAWCDDEVAETVLRMKLAGVTVVRNDAAWEREVQAAPLATAVQRHSEDAAFLVATSAARGSPKVVVHAHRGVVDAHAFACGVLGAHSSDRFYATCGLSFACALGNSLFAGLRVGATVILDPQGPPSPTRVAAMVERFRPTLVFSVPTLYEEMLQAGVARRLAHGSVRHYVSAGEALPATTRRAWREATALAPTSGWGSSETIALVLYCDDDSGLLKPAPLTELGLLHAAVGDVPQRVWLRHRCVACGYWRRTEAQAESLRPGGWFSPAELFLRHPHERLEYRGKLRRAPAQHAPAMHVERAALAA